MQRRMTQLESLEHWFTRLYGRMAGGRMAAACLEDGLERTALRYGHTPDMREAYNRRLDCSAQHWRRRFESLLDMGRLEWSPGMGAAPDMAADGFEDMVLTAVDLGIDPTTIPV